MAKERFVSEESRALILAGARYSAEVQRKRAQERYSKFPNLCAKCREAIPWDFRHRKYCSVYCRQGLTVIG